MQKVLRLSSILFLIAGVGMTLLSIVRSALPYDEEGRYLDAVNGVSYSEAAIMVYTSTAAAFIAIGFLILFVQKRLH